MKVYLEYPILKKVYSTFKKATTPTLQYQELLKLVEILDSDLNYGGIWTSSMILTFVLAISGIIISPSFSMLVFSSREVKSIGTQQVWFSSFLIGFILIFFTSAIGVGSIFLGSNEVINQTGNNISNVLPNNISPDNLEWSCSAYY